MRSFDCLFPCDDHGPRVWCDIQSFEVDRKVYFNNIYTKNECHLIWKIMHGAVPTGRFIFMYDCRYSDSPKYCGGLIYIFVACGRLSGLFQSTKSLISKLTPTFDQIHVWWYLIGITASAGLDVNVTLWRHCTVHTCFV